MTDTIMDHVRAMAWDLPIFEHLGEITGKLSRSNRLQIEAPPGSGKTTIVPLALVDQPWRESRRIVVVQPRRLAARSVALRMSELLTDPIGNTIGFRTRIESKVSSKTTIEVVTEGILLREVLRDPELPQVSAIILDEFHERSLLSELLLALLHEVSDTVRPDLKLIVMSATMGNFNAATSGSYEKVSAEVAPFPVAIAYHPLDQRTRFELAVANVVKEVMLRYHEGDLLVFLPGAGEIERVRNYLHGMLPPSVVVFPLYGELPYSEQKRIFLRNQSDSDRRIILATNIAETSITLPGIRIVIDSGFHKVLRFDPATMLNQLRRERIPSDAATQRAGRAGRLGPGYCLRLWSMDEHKALRPTREPEVLRTDPAGAVLTVLAWGATDPYAFSWITAPSHHAIQQALTQLRFLGLIDQKNRITPYGMLASDLGTSPRLARIGIESVRLGCIPLGAEILSLLESESGSRSPSEHSVDISRRHAFQNRSSLSAGQRGTLSPQEWQKRLRKIEIQQQEVTAATAEDTLALLLCAGYSDRIAIKRVGSPNRYLLATGQGVVLSSTDPLCSSRVLVVVSLRSSHVHTTGDTEIALAASLNSALLSGPLSHLLSTKTDHFLDEELGKFLSVTRTYIGDAVLSESAATEISEAERSAAFFSWITTPKGFARLPWGEKTEQFLLRVRWAKEFGGLTEAPMVSHDVLLSSVGDWLLPNLSGCTDVAAISEELLLEALMSRLPWSLRSDLNTLAPRSITLPNGRERELCYSKHMAPMLEATVQEVLGWQSSPVLGANRVPIIIELLSPARRPIQRTQDLQAFWRGSYKDVRKELRGRYPKHNWPEDPETMGEGKNPRR